MEVCMKSRYFIYLLNVHFTILKMRKSSVGYTSRKLRRVFFHLIYQTIKIHRKCNYDGKKKKKKKKKKTFTNAFSTIFSQGRIFF